MVSSAIRMPLEELIAALERIRVEYADDPEYQELRQQFPYDWPL